jgi:GxxExxY protein
MGLVFDEMSQKIIGAAIEVHKRLGPGFLESVYEQALKIELCNRDISFEAQKEVPVSYDGRVVGIHVLDLLVADRVVVELKAVSRLEDVHFAQVKSYLKATKKNVGLLINFNSPTLHTKRVVLDFNESADRARAAGAQSV